MALEIERKYLLRSEDWKALAHKKISMHQGYLCNNSQTSVRIRIEDEHANINIKSMSIGISRAEYEYSIPVAEASELLKTLCKKPQIQKNRYLVNYVTSTATSATNKLWEIDVFEGDNEGLVVAEIELESENEQIELPEWVGKEVSHLERYYNMRLTQYPYLEWSEAEKLGD